MSSSTAPAEPAREAGPRDARVWPLRAALAVGYLLLAHVASVHGDAQVAGLALLDVVVLVQLPRLLERRVAAWIALLAIAAGLWWLSQTQHVWWLLRLVPVACVAFVAFGFARTLRTGRVPLVTRIVAAMDGCTPGMLAPELQRYARRLTRAWALLLSALAVFDLAMALLATPEQWSWLANIGDYVAIGGFMLVEFAWRRRRFPGRHRSFLGFLRGMLALGPGFWRTVAAP